ncbi:hypothetical protein FN846DRAFT_891123 [Sphaerosporella brunnea]|uniref:Uncharacterized protein n=1 Tax=Sphaerosporella brunnea TaxID=1250544 RepID=A0A5J5ETN7_9PEZI|nr:hypothetical protein FN846DRAFT_891123 [Sphaerosporella brunnea]
MAKRKRIVYETAAMKRRRIARNKARAAAREAARQAAELATVHVAARGALGHNFAVVIPVVRAPPLAALVAPQTVPTTLPVSSKNAPRRRGGPLDWIPVEIHLEILEAMFRCTAPYFPGGGPRFGNWAVWYIPRRRLYWSSYSTFWQNDPSKLRRQQAAYRQKNRETRRAWQVRHFDLRNYLQASPNARRIWDTHNRSLIQGVMREIAEEGGLGPPKTLFNGLEEWPIEALIDEEKRAEPRSPPLVWLRWLTPAGSDLLYLQNLQYSLEMTRADRAGRTGVRDGISEDHWLNRLPPNVHASIIGFIILGKVEENVLLRSSTNSIQQLPFLKDYFTFNRLARKIYRQPQFFAELFRPALNALQWKVDRQIRRKLNMHIQLGPNAHGRRWLEMCRETVDIQLDRDWVRAEIQRRQAISS